MLICVHDQEHTLNTAANVFLCKSDLLVQGLGHISERRPSEPAQRTLMITPQRDPESVQKTRSLALNKLKIKDAEMPRRRNETERNVTISKSEEIDHKSFVKHFFWIAFYHLCPHSRMDDENSTYCGWKPGTIEAIEFGLPISMVDQYQRSSFDQSDEISEFILVCSQTLVLRKIFKDVRIYYPR